MFALQLTILAITCSMGLLSIYTCTVLSGVKYINKIDHYIDVILGTYYFSILYYTFFIDWVLSTAILNAMGSYQYINVSNLHVLYWKWLIL